VLKLLTHSRFVLLPRDSCPAYVCGQWYSLVMHVSQSLAPEEGLGDNDSRPAGSSELEACERAPPRKPLSLSFENPALVGRSRWLRWVHRASDTRVTAEGAVFESHVKTYRPGVFRNWVHRSPERLGEAWTGELFGGLRQIFCTSLIDGSGQGWMIAVQIHDVIQTRVVRRE
jgi:hypothetical protein